jgi:hypothetical protein
MEVLMADQALYGSPIARFNIEAVGSDYYVVDTERPFTDARGQHRFEVICECRKEGDAMQIADALNKADM